MGKVERLSDEEKLERIKFYEENGMDATAKKYNLKNPGGSVCQYRKSLGIVLNNRCEDINKFVKLVKEKGLVVACTEMKISIRRGGAIYRENTTKVLARRHISIERLKEVADFYSKNGRKKTLEKFNLSITAFINMTVLFKKNGIKCNTRQWGKLSDSEKLEIVEYYVENGRADTASHFGLDIETVTWKVNLYATDIGYPKPLRRKVVNSNYLTKREKLERVQFYEEHGAAAGAEKYGFVCPETFLSSIYKYAKEINYQYKTFKNNKYTDEELQEMLEYLETEGALEFEKKYKLDSYAIKAIAERRNSVDDTTKIS